MPTQTKTDQEIIDALVAALEVCQIALADALGNGQITSDYANAAERKADAALRLAQGTGE